MRRFIFLNACAAFALAVAFSPPAFGVTVYMTTTDSATVSGLSFGSGDVVALDTDSGAASIFFSHNNFRYSNGYPGNAGNVDALFVPNNNTIVLSTSSSANLGQPVTGFSDADIVQYDKSSDTAQVLYSETNMFWSKQKGKWKSTSYEDIDALCQTSDGSYLVSTKDSAVIGTNRVKINADDIAKFDPATGTASLFLEGSSVLYDYKGRPANRENIDGVCCDEDTGLIYFSVSGNTFIKTNADGIAPVASGDIVAYDTSTGYSSIFLSLNDLINKWCGTENIDGLCIVGVTSAAPAAVIPEPISMIGLSLGIVGLGNYLRRRRLA